MVNERLYLKTEFLGSGAYASCHLVKAPPGFSCDHLACKEIKKSKLTDLRKKTKVEQELRLHQELKHPRIVTFEHFFEDQDNVYILLELCHKKSLHDLIVARRAHAVAQNKKPGFQGLSEFECKYFLTQIVEGVEYLQS